MIKKIVTVFLVTVFILALAGCGKSRTMVDAPVRNNLSQATDAIEADVYIDGTFSIAGYVNYPGTTVFVDAVKGIERTIAGTWKKETIQYVKFGDENKTIERSEFLGMDNVKFYDQLNTSLDKVIENANENKLNIIVTDLFQTNQDLDSLVLAIKRKTLSNDDKAFAVIGMKSQFKGKIYDVGKNLLQFDYTSNEDKDSYRPFYLLLLGREEDTRNFINSYKTKYPDCKVAMYSKNMSVDNVLLEDTRAVSKKDKNDKAKPMARVSNILTNNEILQFRLNRDVKESKANLIVKGQGLVMDYEDDLEDFTVNVDAVEKWENTDKVKKSSGFMDKITDKGDKGKYSFVKVAAKNFANINLKKIDMDEAGDMYAEMDMRLQPENISNQEGIHRLELSLLPTKKAYIDSADAFADWNIGDDSWETVPFGELGAKTLNISKFSKLLGEMNYELNAPGFHKLYIYFDVK